jgi:hypothetical protein
MALSMFEEPEPCWNLIERTRGKIGDHVAELRLTPGHGKAITPPSLPCAEAVA